MRTILKSMTVATALAGAAALAHAQEGETPQPDSGQTMQQNGTTGGSTMGGRAMMQDGMQGMMPMMQMMSQMAPMMEACTKMMSAMAEDMEPASGAGSNG